MSRSEDYLDQLLRGITPDKTTDTDSKQDISEDNLFSNILEEFAQQSAQENSVEEHIGEEKSDEIFQDEFEDEDIFGDGFSEDIFSEDIFGDDTFTDEDFLKEFEREMAAMEESSEPFEVQNDTLPEENIAEESTTEESTTEESTTEESTTEESTTADEENAALDESSQEDADVLKILEGLNGIDLGLEENDTSSDDGTQEFGVLEDILTDDEAEQVLENTAMDEIAEAEDKSPKKDKKDGFLNKLGLLLFGEEEEDEEDFVLFKKKGADKKTTEISTAEQGEVSIGVATEADLALFEDYSAAPAPEEEAKKEKKKKKEKKEKKEKVKKEKKPKPKKEKKPKKPKEPDNTPPLPKKPVILIFCMVASMVVLIILGSDLLGYSNQLSNAKNLYAKKNYSEAFAEISGMEMKEADIELYNKYHVMAIVSVELEAYESLMSQEFYDMALDCLVRTIGRAEKYKMSAEEYGCVQEMNGLEQEAESILRETFHMSKEQALELYAYKNQKEYSTALVKVLRELGLEKATDSSRR